MPFESSTVILDTIYASQDRSDDIQAGMKSATITFGAYIRGTLLALAAIVVASLAIAGFSNGQGALYFAICVGGLAIVFVSRLYTLDFNNKQSCGKALTVSSI